MYTGFKPFPRGGRGGFSLPLTRLGSTRRPSVSPLVRWGDVEPLGFRNSGIFDESSKKATGCYWKKKGNRVFFTTFKGQAGVFRLSPAHSKKFDANVLHLVPPGCCNASGGETREFSEGRDSFPIAKEDFLRDAK